MSTFKIYRGDIWDLKNHALVVPINMQGVMGRGIARQARDKFIAVEDWLKILIGKYEWQFNYNLPVYYAMSRQESRFLIPLPVKVDFRATADLILIKDCTKALIKTIELVKPERVAIPQLGCGFGDLEWKDVKEVIYPILEPVKDIITIVKPSVNLVDKYPQAFKKSYNGREDKHARRKTD